MSYEKGIVSINVWNDFERRRTYLGPLRTRKRGTPNAIDTCLERIICCHRKIILDLTINKFRQTEFLSHFISYRIKYLLSIVKSTTSYFWNSCHLVCRNLNFVTGDVRFVSGVRIRHEKRSLIAESISYRLLERDPEYPWMIGVRYDE